jgi:hypothetical protein
MLKRSCANCVKGPLFDDTFLNDGLCVLLIGTKELEYARKGERFTVSPEWDCTRFRSPIQETAYNSK